MSQRSVHLAASSRSKTRRAHFGIFIPNEQYDRDTLSQDFSLIQATGTIIHVFGEPVMAGFALEFKRNYECSTSSKLQSLTFLGYIDAGNLYESPPGPLEREYTPRSKLERIASRVLPPPRGQNVRAPVDSVNTKRCQEWTMEFLGFLVKEGLIDPEALAIAQGQRDPPDHGIFGLKKT